MKAKHILIFSLLSVLLQLITVPFGGPLGGHGVKFLVAGILYAALTWFFLSRIPGKKASWIVLLIMIIPILLPLLIDLGIGITHGNNMAHYIHSTRISWPSDLAQIIGVFIGLWLFKAGKLSRIIIVTAWIVLCIWMMLIGYRLWLNKLAFDNYFCLVDEPLPEVVFTNPEGDSLSNPDFKDKIVVLDFWFTGCGYCIAEMPDFQKLSDKYKNEKRVVFYSANNPVREDTIGQAQKMLNENNCSLPLLFVERNITKLLGIKGYPTYMIFAQNRIIYRGNFRGLDKAIRSRLN
jgi:thiol-disulfide isomerase/thioredoxin